MKKYSLLVLLSLLTLLTVNANSSDTITYRISIIDYSLSWTGSREFVFDDEIFVQDVDNIDKTKKDVLVHRQLFGVEKDKIKTYLGLFIKMNLQNEYIDRMAKGERNQKRINIRYGEEEKSIFITNKYQQDIAGFISFLNNFVPKEHGMREFYNPAAPTSASNVK